MEFAVKALNTIGISDIPVVAIAKREELLFTPGAGGALRLPLDSGALMLLRRVRDESHRFAIAANRKAGRKRMSLSALEEVAGVGKILAARLLSKFGSVARMSSLTPEEIASVKGVSIKTARSIIVHLGGPEAEDADM